MPQLPHQAARRSREAPSSSSTELPDDVEFIMLPGPPQPRQAQQRPTGSRPAARRGPEGPAGIPDEPAANGLQDNVEEEARKRRLLLRKQQLAAEAHLQQLQQVQSAASDRREALPGLFARTGVRDITAARIPARPSGPAQPGPAQQDAQQLPLFQAPRLRIDAQPSSATPASLKPSMSSGLSASQLAQQIPAHLKTAAARQQLEASRDPEAAAGMLQRRHQQRNKPQAAVPPVPRFDEPAPGRRHQAAEELLSALQHILAARSSQPSAAGTSTVPQSEAAAAQRTGSAPSRDGTAGQEAASREQVVSREQERSRHQHAQHSLEQRGATRRQAEGRPAAEAPEPRQRQQLSGGASAQVRCSA